MLEIVFTVFRDKKIVICLKIFLSTVFLLFSFITNIMHMIANINVYMNASARGIEKGSGQRARGMTSLLDIALICSLSFSLLLFF